MTDWKTVDGWLTVGEGEKLAELASGRCVLEIGSYCGRSALAMATTAAKIVCIDPFDSSAVEPHPVRDTYPIFLENTRAISCPLIAIRTRIELIEKFLASGTFDMVFVDGDHKYGPCKRDLHIAQRLLKYGGVIVVHDYGTGYPQLQDVTKAVNEVFGRGQITLHESLAIWRSA